MNMLPREKQEYPELYLNFDLETKEPMELAILYPDGELEVYNEELHPLEIAIFGKKPNSWNMAVTPKSRDKLIEACCNEQMEFIGEIS